MSVSVTGSSGTLYSVNYLGSYPLPPTYPTYLPGSSNYPNNYEEHYSISVEGSSRISIWFLHFDIEHHVSCIYDHVKGRLIVIKFFDFSK